MKRIGIRDIAEQAGVSVATVSHVMNGNGRVAEKTKKDVLKVAQDLGFIRNAAAVRLRTGKSRLIGVILNNFVNPFFSQLVTGLELEAYRQGYLTIVATAQNDHERQEKLIHSMLSHGVAAIVISPVHETRPEDLDGARSRNIPVVTCARDIPGSEASFVGADEERSGFLAADALLKVGHRELVFIGGYAQTTTWEGRKIGISKAIVRAGAEGATCRNYPGPISPEFAEQCVSGLIQSGDLGTALICFNDDMAVGVYAAARKSGLAIGKDISIISFDNVPISLALLPQLTTIDISPHLIGQKSAQRAISMVQVENFVASQDLVNPSLVQRGSLGAVNPEN